MYREKNNDIEIKRSILLIEICYTSRASRTQVIRNLHHTKVHIKEISRYYSQTNEIHEQLDKKKFAANTDSKLDPFQDQPL